MIHMLVGELQHNKQQPVKGMKQMVPVIGGRLITPKIVPNMGHCKQIWGYTSADKVRV
jgi:hypothetical protein